MSEPKTYTAADIERYHSGQLSAAERHALEKAALNDPLLADALDGYAFTSTPAADLTLLQKRLAERIDEKKKRRGIFFMSGNWMAAAALVVLMALAGWYLLQSNNKGEVATVSTSPKQLPGLSTNRAADSTSVVSLDRAKEEALPQAEPEAERQAAPRGRMNASPLSAPAAGASVPAPQAQIKTERTDSVFTESNATRDVASANVNNQNTGFKKFMAPASPENRVAVTTDTIRNLNVTMKPNDAGLSEVVVLKPKSANKAAARKMFTVVDTLEPAEGWTNFDDYIANNLKEPEDLKEKGTKGEVELSFDVNKEGEPVNITVTKSLCDKCDEEAIRLLKEGPKWKAKKKKGKVKIKF